MGAEINSTAMQEVGIMRLFHWLEFNWEAAVGWRRQKRLLKSSSETPFFIRELLSFLRPLLVPCPLATSLPPPTKPRVSTAVYILSCISVSGMINRPTNPNLFQLTLLPDSSTLTALTQTEISSHAHRVLRENLLSNFICLLLLPFIVVSSSLHIHPSPRPVPLLPPPLLHSGNTLSF